MTYKYSILGQPIGNSELNPTCKLQEVQNQNSHTKTKITSIAVLESCYLKVWMNGRGRTILLMFNWIQYESLSKCL